MLGYLERDPFNSRTSGLVLVAAGTAAGRIKAVLYYGGPRVIGSLDV